MYTIYLNGEYFNRIVADAEFIAWYCESISDAEHAYTYEEYFYPEPPEEEPETDTDSADDVLNALLGVSE